MKKKLFASFLGVLLIVSLAGCTKNVMEYLGESKTEEVEKNTEESVTDLEPVNVVEQESTDNTKQDSATAIRQFNGNWILDFKQTTEHLEDGQDIMTIFGSGLKQYGANLSIAEKSNGNAYFEAEIGIGISYKGEVSYEEDKLVFKGERYIESKEEYSTNISIVLTEEQTYLILREYDVDLYFKKSAEEDALETSKDSEKILAETLEIVKNYDTRENGESVLGFILFGDSATANEKGNYEMDALILAPVMVKTHMEVGETVEVCTDEINGETMLLTMCEGGVLLGEDGMEYWPESTEGEMTGLVYLSDDQLMAAKFRGRVEVSPDAIVRVAIIDSEKEASLYQFSESDFFNGVIFGEDGVISKLTFYGD